VAQIVVGVDLSLTSTGIARITDNNDPELAVYGREGISTLPLYERLDAVSRLAGTLQTLIFPEEALVAPALVVIERMEVSRAYGGLVERAWLWQQVVSWLWFGQGIPVAEVTPASRMRYATGKGAASKSAVVDAVARRLPMFETKGDDNLADAAILCAMGRDYLGEPLAAMPATHRAALDAVKWPN